MEDDTCARTGCMEPRAPKGVTGPRSPYCSRSCRDRDSYARRRVAGTLEHASRRSAQTKTCPQCGAMFTPAKTARQRFCSKSCGSKFHRDSSTAACSVEDCERPVRAKELCSSHYNAQQPNRSTWKKNGNPEVRRAALRRKTQQRRARIKGDLNAGTIDRDQVGDRDGWACGLCRKPVDRTLPWPDPQSASLDHIEPLSLGGLHVLANVQIAHLVCNAAKGNRVTDVQPLLVG